MLTERTGIHRLAKQPRKIRADFRKNRNPRARQRDLTRRFQEDENLDDDALSERVSGKGELTRRRTVLGLEGEGESGLSVLREVDPTTHEPGCVICVRGLNCVVRTNDGRDVTCATRRVLKTLATDQRHVVATGDRVAIRRSGPKQGIIERIEPRHGVLARTSRGRQHVVVANIDRMIIVASAAQPDLKPHLIDRMLVTAEHSAIEPLICINKIDLVDPAALQPLIGVYAQLGYRLLLTSAVTGRDIDQLQCLAANRQCAVVGQSGVGKSSLLNCLQPGLDLLVREISLENQKGKHTTTNATLIPLESGGWIVDTPGIRQFELWDITRQEIAGLFRDLRPYVSRCRFPNCTHTHEADCAVKDAVADHRVDLRRYESYCHMQAEG